MDRAPISIVVPNWNGADLLERHLPGILNELGKHHAEGECIVVDDASTDGSVILLREKFPRVFVVSNSTNHGFSSTVNRGINLAKHERILLLNNDVAVTPGFLDELQDVFDQDAATFAVSALQKQQLPDGAIGLDGFNTVKWHDGHLNFTNATDAALHGQSSRLAYCTAGCALFSHTKLSEIGGFANLFDPFYYEDAEVGLQAAKRGWLLRFAPNSVVWHSPGSTSKRKAWFFRFAPVRNYFILHWLLIDNTRLWIEHIFYVCCRLVWWTVTGRLRYVAGFVLAICRLSDVMSYRRRRSTGWQIRLADFLDA